MKTGLFLVGLVSFFATLFAFKQHVAVAGSTMRTDIGSGFAKDSDWDNYI